MPRPMDRSATLAVHPLAIHDRPEVYSRAMSTSSMQMPLAIAGAPGGARGTGASQDAGVTKQRFDLVVRNGTIVTPGR